MTQTALTSAIVKITSTKTTLSHAARTAGLASTVLAILVQKLTTATSVHVETDTKTTAHRRV